MRILLTLLSIVAVAFANKQCSDVNEHFERCGTACPLSCDNYNNPPEVCSLQCEFGCQCDKGYVRHPDGRCVRSEECPARTEQKCGANAHFKECGSPCPLTCDNHDNPPKNCIERCEIGCQCDDGYVIHSNGSCVRRDECPDPSEPVCGGNETYTTCGAMCQFTCDNYYEKQVKCPSGCFAGCRCVEGYYKNKEGRCIRKRECPRDPRKNCIKKPWTGECNYYVTKYYYDTNSASCTDFEYGGCGGNGNRFDTKDGCKKYCEVEECFQEKDLGSICNQFSFDLSRWFFNKKTGKCENFLYKGCGGNSNRFYTKASCDNLCLG